MTCAVVKNAKGSFCAAISGDIFTLKEMTFEETRRFSSFYVYHPDGGNCAAGKVGGNSCRLF